MDRADAATHFTDNGVRFRPERGAALPAKFPLS